MVTSKINPRFIQGFYADFSSAELSRIFAWLARVPGDSAGIAALWFRFQRNDAVSFFGRNDAGEIAFFSFYELKITDSGRLEFFIGPSATLQPSHDLTETSFPQFEFFARHLGCDSIAFKTPRAGLVRKVQKMAGWQLRPELDGGEFFMRKVLTTDPRATGGVPR